MFVEILGQKFVLNLLGLNKCSILFLSFGMALEEDALYLNIKDDLGKLRNQTLDMLGGALGIHVELEKKAGKVGLVASFLMPKD
eukprot:5229823-Karenia_brevis.AAC.1